MNGDSWFSTDLQNCIEDTVQKLINPTSNFSSKDPGLLLGKIQSGKNFMPFLIIPQKNLQTI